MVNHLFASPQLSFLYDPDMESKLREYLLEKQVLNNWKQDEMADLLTVPKGTLSRWLSGQFTPGLSSLKKIAHGLGVPLQEVIDAVDGTYTPMSQSQRNAKEIMLKYNAESVVLAFQELSEKLNVHGPEEVLRVLQEEQEKRA